MLDKATTKLVFGTLRNLHNHGLPTKVSEFRAITHQYDYGIDKPDFNDIKTMNWYPELELYKH